MAAVIEGVEFIGLIGMCTNSDAKKMLCIVLKHIYFVSKSSIEITVEGHKTMYDSFFLET